MFFGGGFELSFLFRACSVAPQPSSGVSMQVCLPGIAVRSGLIFPGPGKVVPLHPKWEQVEVGVPFALPPLNG